jgi:hypothetical protein
MLRLDLALKRSYVRSDREVHDVSAGDLEKCRLFNSLLDLLWGRNTGRCDKFHAVNPSRALVTCSVTA